ncbi:initiator tRNA phosphoribosyl transferase [Paxillus ammoniavirescens]|nr:initiator tRNA phosphoribosyl transferase [Paxillus ammoniavirescens]
MDAREATTEALAELRKESQDIFNRLHSIAEDAVFVRQVHAHYPDLPLLPNMRCGAWYTDPKIVSTERAYFKSTDGHTNNWSFNLRRPNLHILPLVVKHAGLVLVDSTRAGKRIPDALSKTVPIWCSVINRAMLKKSVANHPHDWDTALYTPPGVVSPQEHSQIERKLDAWASELAASFYELPKLDYPLRPIWITPATSAFPRLPAEGAHSAFYPIVCVSASKQVVDGLERRATGFAYIQGSGDDHELWSMGLTPTIFWNNHASILRSGRSELPNLVRSLVEDSSDANVYGTDDPNQALIAMPIERVSGLLSICSVAILRSKPLLAAHPEIALLCVTSKDPEPSTSNAELRTEGSVILWIQTLEGKKGQNHFLNTVLPRSLPFIRSHLQKGRKVCIACDSGTDVSVGVCVAALAKYFRTDGSFYPRGNEQGDICTSKDILKTRLQWIISSYPQANPSRTTLKRVNDFLLSPFFTQSGTSAGAGVQSPSQSHLA